MDADILGSFLIHGIELANVLFGIHKHCFQQVGPSHCKSQSNLIKQCLGTGRNVSLHWGDIISWLDAR